ncbi:hypothetical protein [Variovorax paradoxus]|uniref:hypothetical protein n=1 Tax=Variovorax paradoxus TaxID=34073 RepID=UPI002784A33C|nr:hypothetical protein [Variovorax paradoxus]MDQ0588272.1 hypothetical protein [Variovorax paradoxus]
MCTREKHTLRLGFLLFLVFSWLYFFSLWVLISVFTQAMQKIWPAASVQPLIFIASVSIALFLFWWLDQRWSFKLDRRILFERSCRGALARKIKRTSGVLQFFILAWIFYLLLSYRPPFYDLFMAGVCGFGLLSISIKNRDKTA